MGTSDTDEAALWYALYRLFADYWDEVDGNGGREAHTFYLPDALYAVGDNRFEGAEKIRAFYARRRQYGQTTTRHLVTNLRVFAEDGGQPRALGVMTLFRADGRTPVRGTRPPALIADFEAVCARGNDGRWRFRSHVLRPVFVGSDLPASISIDPQRL